MNSLPLHNTISRRAANRQVWPASCATLPFLTLACVVLACAASPLVALEHVSFARDGKTQHVSGRLVVEAVDGGLLVESSDGVLWDVQPDEITERTNDSQPFHRLDKDKLAEKVRRQLPSGFEVYTTSHYLICHNTSRAYATWCGSLFERLHMAFTNYWRRRGFELHEPPGPLVVVVFADSASYQQHAADELGQTASSIVGYYSLRTNRITMYDLSGLESLRAPGDRHGNVKQINAMLSRPAALPLVATVVHEATHQIVFNCGLQTRYADIPLWVSEGLAIYFETPDLSSATGWRGIGRVNRPRLIAFRKNLAKRADDALESLIADDRRFRDAGQAADAYADAWALNYYLIRQRPKQYADFLQHLAKKQPLVWNTPEERLAEFKKFFGDDLAELETDFLRQMRKVR